MKTRADNTITITINQPIRVLSNNRRDAKPLYEEWLLNFMMSFFNRNEITFKAIISRSWVHKTLSKVITPGHVIFVKRFVYVNRTSMNVLLSALNQQSIRKMLMSLSSQMIIWTKHTKSDVFKDVTEVLETKIDPQYIYLLSLYF